MTTAATLLHVWIDDFFVTVERLANPALRGRPVVIGGCPGGAGRVVAASVEALASGVTIGMSLREAGRRCPDAAFLPGHLERLLDASCGIDEAVRRAWRHLEWAAIDEATIDLAAVDRGHATRLAERIRLGVQDAGFSAACGIAGGRVAARVAARMARPRGVLCVLPGYDERFLAGLDVACLDACAPDALRRLRRAGVTTLGGLAALTRAQAVALLGRDGPSVARLAAGEDHRPVAATAVPRRLCRALRFDDAEPSLDAARAATVALAEELGRRLRLSGYGARQLTLRVDGGDGRSWSAAAEVDEAAEWADVVPWTMRGLAAGLLPGCAGMRAVTVSASRLFQAGPQPSLFPLRPDAAAMR
jgi:DNA polymerase-4